jgi:hypothetical protein
MLHPYELDVPKLPISVAVQKGGTWEKEGLPTPAILTSSWQSPAGNIGHLFVNIAETRQRLTVALDTRNAPAKPAYDVQVYRSAQDATFQPLWQRVSLPKEFVAELEPLETVFVELGGAE